jgi:class 3 adenylate cyclase
MSEERDETPAQPPGEEITQEHLQEARDGEPLPAKAAKIARALLPIEEDADRHLGVESAADRVERKLAERNAEKPSAMREIGLTALQLFQAAAETRGQMRGERDVVILFTDLVEFSAWALEAGDQTALRLLREVAAVDSEAVHAHSGEIVKRLGDGLMAAFKRVDDAVDAAFAIGDGLAQINVDGHTPQVRAGVHIGRPRKVKGDYLGVDVNIAARVADAAKAGQVLVSGPALEQLDQERYKVAKQRWFRAKGAPKDLDVFIVKGGR